MILRNLTNYSKNQKKKKRRKKTAPEIESSSESDEKNDDDQDQQVEETDLNESLDEIEHKPKNSKIKSKKIRASESVIFKTSSLLNKFYSHSPAWGGVIKSLDHIYNGFAITNTCSFDYILFGLWLSTQLSERVKNVLADSNTIRGFDKTSLNVVINFIEQNNWNEAKTIWIIDILKMIPNELRSFRSFVITILIILLVALFPSSSYL
jgi:hypothetical protein